MDKKALSERDICTKFITPALRQAGWDEMTQLREEVSFTKGRIIVRGKMVSRGKEKRADYILYYRPNIPLAVIEAKDNNCHLDDGLQQALEYGEMLQLPFVFASNGDGFVLHDRTITSGEIERTLPLDQFPSPDALWARYREWKGLPAESESLVLQNYYSDGDKGPRYYQASAVNAAIEAIAKGQNRLLLVMATGTGKTYTAFQIIWRLWRAGRKKRILYLADRNVLIDQTMVNDFRPFGSVMAKLSTSSKVIERDDGTRVDLPIAIDKKRRIDTSYEVYLGLYQALTGVEERQKLFKELSPNFFDLIVVDECHRGSAAEDSAWRDILSYFSGATQIGMTATPKETEYVSNIHYFGAPIYSYSLKQGIRDGFLAPYKVVKVHIDRDIEGYRPEPGKKDKEGIDFRKATNHFADPEFDGEPVQIYEPGPDDPIVPPDAPPVGDDEPIPPAPGQDETVVVDPNIEWKGHGDPTPYRKTYVDGVPVNIVAERVEYLDGDGRLVTESLRDFSKKTIRKQFGSLDAFLASWNGEARKQAIVEQLAREGLLLTALADEVGKDLDPFDLICHVAFDRPPLTRHERVANVRKRDVFTSYGPQARLVLDALLQKYQDEGVTDLDDPRILQIRPFDAMGTPVELIRRFGTRRDFERAVAALQSALYQGVA